MAGVGLVAAGVALTSGGGRSLIDTVCSGVKKCATALACAATKLATTAADIVSPKPAAVPATGSVAIAQEKVETKEKKKCTPIYRYGGTNPGNLTPKEKDKYSGLSFSTVPMRGAATTTIELLNATGIVYAIQDSPTHVSVRPVGGTMEDWINAGSSSIWTQTVKALVVKWDGN